MLAASVVGGIVFLFVVMQLAASRATGRCSPACEPAQTGKIASTLAAQGIPYQLQSAGTAVGVPASDVASARIALASANLLSPSESSSTLFNNSSLGQSDFQQQVGYQVALEQQLQDTIDQVQGVSELDGPARDPELAVPALRPDLAGDHGGGADRRRQLALARARSPASRRSSPAASRVSPSTR